MGKKSASVLLNTYKYYETEKTHTNHIAVAAISAADGFIFPFIGKVKQSLSHLFIRLGDSFSSHTSQPQHLSGCSSRGAAERKLSLSAQHVWAALCPGAHICNLGTLWSCSPGSRGDGGCWSMGYCNPYLGTDQFPCTGTEDGWKWVVHIHFYFGEFVMNSG